MSMSPAQRARVRKWRRLEELRKRGWTVSPKRTRCKHPEHGERSVAAAALLEGIG